MNSNQWFDRISLVRGGNAFRSFGLAGFTMGALIFFGGAALLRLDLWTALAIAGATAALFFGYAKLRQRITGRESHVLFEHLWLSLFGAAALAYFAHQPVLRYLDLFAAAAAGFLSLGRIGCLFAGCCFGSPSAWGIVYEDGASRAVPRHLWNVRLLPVQLLESLGCGAIAVISLFALAFTSSGTVFVFFLVAYAVLRFGLEGLRGDDRPQWLGISGPRWCAAAQFLFVLAVANGATRSSVLGAALLGAAALGIAYLIWTRSPRRHWLDPTHIAELRSFIETEPAQGDVPRLRLTRLGCTVGISADSATYRVSLSAPGMDVADLCRLASQAWGRFAPEYTQYSNRGVLQFALVSMDTGDGSAWKKLYREAVLSTQRAWR